MVHMSPARRLSTLAVLSAAGAVLFVIESFIPMPLPFMKIGLANVSGVIALALLGPRGVLWVTVVRVIVGSLFAGTLFGPGFLLAIGAGLAAALAMSVAHALAPRLFSPLGISLIGATVHAFAQFLLVSFVIVRSTSLSAILPMLLVTALVGGCIVGLTSIRVLRLIPEARR